MGTPQIPSVDSDSKQFPAAVRQRIAANLADPSTVEGAALAGLSRLAPSTAFRSLKSALDAGRPACFMWIGDSTGDSDGTNSSDLRTPTRLAQAIGAAFPSYHIVSKTLLTDGSGYGPSVVLQNAPGGRRYAQFSGSRSIRYRPADYTKTRFTTGNMDLRILYKPNSTWSGSSDRALIVRRRQDTDGATGSTALEQFRFILEAAGTLRLDWSTNGTSLDRQNNRSSVAISAPTDTPLWLRVTLVYSGGSWTTRYYTSPDNVNWTDLGTPTGPFAASPMFDSYLGFFEVGAEGWQPASTSALGNVYEVEIRDGVNGPTLAPVLPELWERYGDSTAATYGGAPTLVLLNASRSGTNMAYHTNATRLPVETADYGQQVVVFNDSHNENASSGPAGWTTPYRAWVAAVQARLPLAAFAVVLQNPHTSAWVNETAFGYSHQLRIDELRSLAAAQGWGIVDVFSAFLNDQRGLGALVQSDGLHPTQDGYALAAKVAARAVGIS